MCVDVVYIHCTLQDEESRGEVREDINKELSENDNTEVVTIDNFTSINDPVISSEVTIATVNDNYDDSGTISSTQHNEVVQSSNISILIPSHKEGLHYCVHLFSE